MNKLLQELQQAAAERETRRHFLHTCSTGLGAMAFGSLLQGCNFLTNNDQKNNTVGSTTQSDEPTAPHPSRLFT